MKMNYQPAYPHTVTFIGPCYDSIGDKDIPVNHTESYTYLGMDIRDYFAGQMLPMAYSIMDREWRADGEQGQFPVEDAARIAYEMADEMMKRRKQGAATP